MTLPFHTHLHGKIAELVIEQTTLTPLRPNGRSWASFPRA